jgi:integrase
VGNNGVPAMSATAPNERDERTPAERIQDALKNPGKHSFGNSLFLVTRPSGKGYWIQQYRDGQSFRSKSLGTVADLNSYSKAVKAAQRYAVKRDDDKADDETTKAAGPLFAALVADYLDGYDRDGEHVPGKAEGWRGSSEADTYRRNLIERGKLAPMYVVKITPQDIAAHLRLFEGKPKTAERVRSHIQNVMAFAIAREIRKSDIPNVTPDNPAAAEGPLKHLPWPKLTEANNVVTPHPAMPGKDVPKFFHDLQTIPTGQPVDPVVTHSARALSFIVLTTLRAQEAVGAKWNEVDTKEMIFTVPGSRMKGKGRGRPHAIPLTPEMLRVIGEPGAPDDYIFPGDADGHVGEKSPMHTLRTLYKGDADVHGFRSTFSDWVVDHTDINDREALADLALGHLRHRDKTQRQYLRSTRLEQRRPVMQAWSDFVTGAANDGPHKGSWLRQNTRQSRAVK